MRRRRRNEAKRKETQRQAVDAMERARERLEQGGQEEEEEKEAEASTSSDLLSIFAAAPKATPDSVFVFADAWNDFFCVTSSAASGSSGAGLPTHRVWASGFYSTVPIPYWIVFFSLYLGESGYIYLDMSEHTCGRGGGAFDATVPDVALDMSIGGAALAVYRPCRRLPCCGAEANPHLRDSQLPHIWRSMFLLRSLTPFHRSLLTCRCATTGARWIRSAEHCGSSAVAVLRNPSTSLSWRKGFLPWSSR